MAVILHGITLNKANLLTLTEVERKWFVLAGHIANEIMALQRQSVQCMNHKPTSEIGKRGYVVQNWIVTKLLIGKLHEAREAMRRYYFPTISREYFPQLPEDAQEAQRTITRYFQGDNPISRLRNEAAFHYSFDNDAAVFEALPEDQELLLYLGEADGNSLYFCAEELLFADKFPRPAAEEARAAFDGLIGDSIRIARAFSVFLAGCMYVAVIKMVPGRELRREVVPEGDTGHIDRTSIPYFLDAAGREVRGEGVN